MPTERTCYFISVNFTNVIQTFKQQSIEWLEKYANVLRQMGIRELEAVKKEITSFREQLKTEPDDKDELQKVLNQIA